uniref:Baculovirus repeated ORF n n=1 Tax=Lymantria dispar multicapsid nuclear polyhedrosis virus TaxID=10449 RepID=A0A1B1MQX8_NPVLD|nr:baculovirus repeated ORF n [Lymantria dispar multiple nucleopolyhedrovirus]
MSQVKIGQFKFGEDLFRLRYVLERERPVKFVAKDIANSLKYVDCKQAVRINVDDKYKSTFQQGCTLNTLASNSLIKQGDPLYLHPSTILITKEGVIQLIMKSKLPYAVELQAWLLEEVIPQVLCTGKYRPQPAVEESNMKSVQSNNEVQIATLNVLNQMSASLQLRDEQIKIKDEQITVLIAENKQLTGAIINLSNRMADVAQDVIAKPSDPQLCHTLAVCEIGQNEYAFLRPQKRSLQRSINQLRKNGEVAIVYKSDYVPNSVNVLNKVKERVPRDKFKATSNKITLLEEYDKNKLIEIIDVSLTDRQLSLIQKRL